MVVASTEKLPALVKPLEMLKGRVRTVVVWGAGDADAAAVRALLVAWTFGAGRGARRVPGEPWERGLLSGPVFRACGCPGTAGMPAIPRAGMPVLRFAGDANKHGIVLPSLGWLLTATQGCRSAK